MSRNPHELPQSREINIAVQSLKTIEEKNKALYEIRLRTASILYTTGFSKDDDLLVASMLYSGFADESLSSVFNDAVLKNVKNIRSCLGSRAVNIGILDDKYKAVILAQIMASVEFAIEVYDKAAEADSRFPTMLKNDMDDLMREMSLLEKSLPEFKSLNCPEMIARCEEIILHIKSLNARENGDLLINLPRLENQTKESFKKIGRKPF